MSGHHHPVPTLLSVNIHLTLPQDPEADHVDHPPSPGVWPGASWVENPSTRLINDLFPAPASSNARNYTEWATQTTFINVEFFNSIFLRDTYLMIYDLSRSFSLVASLPRCCLIRCHPSPDDTGWQLDMITNNLQEQSGPHRPRADHEISENQFLICCLQDSDNAISENKS